MSDIKGIAPTWSRCAWLINCALILCFIFLITESSGIAFIDLNFFSVKILSLSCIETIAGRKKPSSKIKASSSSSTTTIFLPTSEKPPTVCIFTICFVMLLEFLNCGYWYAKVFIMICVILVMGIECVYNNKDMLERNIINIVESGDGFVVGDFPLDGDVRNYKIFLNSYKTEKERIRVERLRNFLRQGAYVNGYIGERELFGID